ncbi:MAG: hypothetical protein GY822_13195 [Deltaproteobacteria bacterium]|nr:hypothetical protein [Deltaproteobacteria bacterium]
MANLKSTAHISRRAECDIVVDTKALKRDGLCTEQCIACGQRKTEKKILTPTYLALPSTWALLFAASYGGLLALASMAPEFAWYHSTRNLDYGFLVDVCMRWQIALPFISVVFFGATLLPFLRWRRLRLCTPCTSGFRKARRRSFFFGSFALFLIPLCAYLVGQALFRPGSFSALSFASVPALAFTALVLFKSGSRSNPILDLSVAQKGKLRIRGPRSIKDVLLDEKPDIFAPKVSEKASQSKVSGTRASATRVSGTRVSGTRVSGTDEASKAKSVSRWIMVSLGIAFGLCFTLGVHLENELLACPNGTFPKSYVFFGQDGKVKLNICRDGQALHGHITLRRTDGSIVLGGYNKGVPTGNWIERGRFYVDDKSRAARTAHDDLQKEMDGYQDHDFQRKFKEFTRN